MATKAQILKFVKSQRSIHLYKKVQKALADVLLAMPSKDYALATKNTILMVLHETAFGQLMHVNGIRAKSKILQLSIAKKAPMYILQYVIAHEFGHGMQGRNWKNGDGMKLEENADAWAEKWGFPKTKKIKAWMEKQ